MKLLFCPICYDVFKLTMKTRKCECGRCEGHYINDLHATVNGNGYSLAIDNWTLSSAVLNLQTFDAESTRKEYFENEVKCWVRPHSGPGNPHTEVGIAKQPTPTPPKLSEKDMW